MNRTAVCKTIKEEERGWQKITPIYRLPTFAGKGDIGIDGLLACMQKILPAKRKGKVKMSVYVDKDNWIAYTLSGAKEAYENLPPGRFTIIGEYWQQRTEEQLLNDIVAALTDREGTE